MSRPEHLAPPELFYNDKEASKYAQSTRMMQIQRQISERALELLNLPPGRPAFLLDVGCGTGMSGAVLESNGHMWVGMDISESMLNIASTTIASDASNGDVVHADMGAGLGFRGGSFDGVISISAVQWLCYANHKHHVPKLRLKRFFQTLYASLRRGGRAVIQLYAETPQQMELITNVAMAVGFTGGVVVDYPNSAKAKKMYLVLMTGPSQHLPASKVEEVRTRGRNEVDFESRRTLKGNKRDRRQKLTDASLRERVLAKKERQRKQGKDVRNDSKYSGRRRRNKF